MTNSVAPSIVTSIETSVMSSNNDIKEGSFTKRSIGRLIMTIEQKNPKIAHFFSNRIIKLANQCFVHKRLSYNSCNSEFFKYDFYIR